jgi:hypothetical protein
MSFMEALGTCRTYQRQPNLSAISESLDGDYRTCAKLLRGLELWGFASIGRSVASKGDNLTLSGPTGFFSRAHSKSPLII